MTIKGTNIVITGGAGFIGSSLVKKLVVLGSKVKVFDNLSSGTLQNLKTVRSKITFVKGDILNKKLLIKEFNKADIVSHQAAQLEITRAIDDPTYDLKINTIGTINVLSAAGKCKVKNCYNASSACVYGQAKTKIQTENHLTNPNWGYGVSKLAAEKYAHIISNQTNLPVTSLRYSIVYGPNEWYGRVLTILLKRALENKDLVIFGQGSQIRDFVFIDDVVDLNIKCITNRRSENQIFNVSTGKPTSISTLAKLVKRYLNPCIKIIKENVKKGETSKIINRQRLPQELQRMTLSPKKAKKLLNWHPKTSLKQGLIKEFKWLKNNKSRWKNMSY